MITEQQFLEILKANSHQQSLSLVGHGFNHRQMGQHDHSILANFIKNTPKLTALEIRGGGLSNQDQKEVLDAIAQNHSALTCLDLSGNSLNSDVNSSLISIIEKNPSLTSINLGQNNLNNRFIRNLVLILPTLTALNSLRLYFNKFEGIAELSSAVKTNTSLTYLDLAHNELETVDAEYLAAALRVNSSLRFLNLNNNRIGNDGAKVLAKALKKTRLRTLKLKSNHIGNRGYQEIAFALKNNTSLQELDLADNRAKDKGAKALAEALAINSSLTSLILSFNQRFGEEGGKALAKALALNKGLQFIDLCNSFSTLAAAELGEALQRNTTLTDLKLQKNNLGINESRILANALGKNRALKRLEYDFNRLSAEGAQSLAEVLKTNHTLEYLRLLGNRLGANGATNLAHALKKNKGLKFLCVNENQCCAQDAIAFAEALKKNKTLLYLDLGNNAINSQGYQALAKALTKNATLISLNLGRGKFNLDTEAVQALGEALKVNRSLTHLDLDNVITNDGEKGLAEALKSNFVIRRIDGVKHPDIETILKNNNRICDQLSELTSRAYRGQAFTKEEIEEFERIKNTFSQLPIHKNQDIHQRSLIRKIEPFLDHDVHPMYSKLQRTLALIDIIVFDLIVMNVQPEEDTLKSNTIVFVQKKYKDYGADQALRDYYVIDTIYCKDSLGKMYVRAANGFNLHYFLKTDNANPLSTAFIQPYKTLIENELHIRGIIRQYTNDDDTDRMVTAAWSQVTSHPFILTKEKDDPTAAICKQKNILTRWFDENVANSYYEYWGNQINDLRTIDEGLDEQSLAAAITAIGNAIDAANKENVQEEINSAVSEKKQAALSSAHISACSFFALAQNPAANADLEIANIDITLSKAKI